MPESPEKMDKRTYWALNGTMFQGAFSDNVIRFILSMLALDVAMAATDTSEAGNALGAQYVMYIGIVFALPWILAFSLSGWLSDRFSKARVTQGTKCMEIATMLFACVALGLANLWLGLVVMFFMSLQSALFSPSKYGILPEVLPENRVGWGNGVLQGFTFAAILVGTIVGPLLYGAFTEELWIPGVLLVTAAGAGLGISLTMRKVPPADPKAPPRYNPLLAIKSFGPTIARHTGLRWAFTGVFVFWILAVALQSAVIQLLKNILQLDDSVVGLAYLPVVIGNGVGAFLVSLASRKGTVLWPILAGAVAMGSGCAAVWMLTPTEVEQGVSVSRDVLFAMMAVLGLTGLGAGMFIVPLNTFVIETSDAKLRGGIWGVLNFATAVAWLAGAVFYQQTTALRGSPGDTFLASAALLAVTAVVMTLRFPALAASIGKLFGRN